MNLIGIVRSCTKNKCKLNGSRKKLSVRLAVFVLSVVFFIGVGVLFQGHVQLKRFHQLVSEFSYVEDKTEESFNHLESLFLGAKNQNSLVFCLFVVSLGLIAILLRELVIIERRNSHSALAEAITASVDGVFLIKQGKIIFLNSTGRSILGLSQSRVIHEDVFEKALLRESECTHKEGYIAIMRAASSLLPSEVTIESGGQKNHYLVQSFPITESLMVRVTESFGNGVNKVLKRFGADTIILARNVTTIKESQEAKGHFLASLSHEVKTPVTSLTMATRLLKRSLGEVSNPRMRNLILTCASDVDRLRLLLENFVTASRYDSFVQGLEFREIDFLKLIQHSIQSFQEDARAKNISLKYEVVNPDWLEMTLKIDATKLAWAISNLFSNALKYTPDQGKVLVRIFAFGDRIEVRVMDSGPGLESYRIERIFERFNPYYNIRVAKSGFSATGLSIAREIIGAHNGRIWVKSDFGKGAEFCFSIPREKVVSSLRTVADEFEEKHQECNIVKGVSGGTYSCGG